MQDIAYILYWRKEINVKSRSDPILSMFIILLISSLYMPQGQCQTSNQSQSDIISLSPESQITPEKELVTSVNSNMLICSIAEKYGIGIIRSAPGPGGFRPIKKTDPPNESISILPKLNNLERHGARFTLMKNEKAVGMVQIGVFNDPNAALKMYTDHMLYTSIGPNRNLSGDIGNKSAGWWDVRNQGFKRILFTRDNVVVSIHLFSKELISTGLSRDVTMNIAKAIDTALAEGTLGVLRYKVLKTPRILAVNMPTNVTARTKVEAQIHIAVQDDPQNKDSKETEILRTIQFSAPAVSADDKTKPEKNVMYEMTYITAGCVVSSKQVVLTLTPR